MATKAVRGVQARASVRVVVRSAGRQTDAELPADLAVAQLVPEVLRVVFGSTDGNSQSHLAWTLSFPGGDPFPDGSTLTNLEVVDGAVLQLEQAGRQQPGSAVPSGAANDAAASDGADARLPRQRTLASLPRRRGAGGRLAGALVALVRRERAAPLPALVEPAPGTMVSPAQLTIPRRPSAFARARAHWRGSAYEHRLDCMIQDPQLRRCVTIAVMSPKGGVGKTTVSALLGTLFALLRRDRIVAVDTNPDFGSLGRSLAPGHDVYVDDVLEVLDGPELTVTALDARLGRAVHGLMVLPVPTQPARMARLDEEVYTRVVGRLQSLVGMILLDCGTGLQDPAARAALRTADQVLLITDTHPSSASLVAEAAGLLKEEKLPTWLVVNKMASGSRLQISSLEAHIPDARGLLIIPRDEAGANRVAAGVFDWRDAPAAWRVAGRELAAALVADWSSLGLSG